MFLLPPAILKTEDPASHDPGQEVIILTPKCCTKQRALVIGEAFEKGLQTKSVIRLCLLTGLLAGRPAHSAQRRRPAVRHGHGAGPGSHDAAQAHQGGARPLVLPRRQVAPFSQLLLFLAGECWCRRAACMHYGLSGFGFAKSARLDLVIIIVPPCQGLLCNLCPGSSSRSSHTCCRIPHKYFFLIKT
jgi:hypothetical protein